jgi:hypothetical protein
MSSLGKLEVKLEQTPTVVDTQRALRRTSLYLDALQACLDVERKWIDLLRAVAQGGDASTLLEVFNTFLGYAPTEDYIKKQILKEGERSMGVLLQALKLEIEAVKKPPQ